MTASDRDQAAREAEEAAVRRAEELLRQPVPSEPYTARARRAAEALARQLRRRARRRGRRR
jgi:hypothetical protein